MPLKRPNGGLYLEFARFWENRGPSVFGATLPAAESAQIPTRIRAYNSKMDHSKLVVVDRFASQVEADLAKTALASAGIDAAIQADRAGGMRDHLAWSGLGFKVLVREEDAIEAHEVLQPPPEGELVFLQAFRTQAEADNASNALLSAGVLATIQDTVARVPLSLISNDFAVRLLVRREDFEKARYVLGQAS